MKYSKVPRTRKEDRAAAVLQAALDFYETHGALPQGSKDPTRAEERLLANQVYNSADTKH